MSVLPPYHILQMAWPLGPDQPIYWRREDQSIAAANGWGLDEQFHTLPFNAVAAVSQMAKDGDLLAARALVIHHSQEASQWARVLSGAPLLGGTVPAAGAPSPAQRAVLDHMLPPITDIEPGRKVWLGRPAQVGIGLVGIVAAIDWRFGETRFLVYIEHRGMRGPFSARDAVEDGDQLLVGGLAKPRPETTEYGQALVAASYRLTTEPSSGNKAWRINFSHISDTPFVLITTEDGADIPAPGDTVLAAFYPTDELEPWVEFSGKDLALAIVRMEDANSRWLASTACSS